MVMDQNLVGQEEYDQQCNRHSGGKQLTKLAKSIARILLVAGLESGTSSRGVGAVTVLDEHVLFGTKMIALLLGSMVFCIVNAKHVDLLRLSGLI